MQAEHRREVAEQQEVDDREDRRLRVHRPRNRQPDGPEDRQGDHLLGVVQDAVELAVDELARRQLGDEQEVERAGVALARHGGDPLGVHQDEAENAQGDRDHRQHRRQRRLHPGPDPVERRDADPENQQVGTFDNHRLGAVTARHQLSPEDRVRPGTPVRLWPARDPSMSAAGNVEARRVVRVAVRVRGGVRFRRHRRAVVAVRRAPSGWAGGERGRADRDRGLDGDLVDFDQSLNEFRRAFAFAFALFAGLVAAGVPDAEHLRPEADEERGGREPDQDVDEARRADQPRQLGGGGPQDGKDRAIRVQNFRERDAGRRDRGEGDRERFHARDREDDRQDRQRDRLERSVPPERHDEPHRAAREARRGHHRVQGHDLAERDPPEQGGQAHQAEGRRQRGEDLQERGDHLAEHDLQVAQVGH